MYVDPVLAALFEGLGALFGGGALASAAGCCGMPLGLILLIIGLVTSSGPAPMPAQAYGQPTIMPTTLGTMPTSPGMQTYAPVQQGMAPVEQPAAQPPAVAEHAAPETAQPWDHVEGPL
jgi:hypothetical protein